MVKEKLKTIYNLELHETLWVSAELTIQRVPGGWNYKYYEYRNLIEYHNDYILINTIFIPYHNEFQIYDPF
jgi:hypothetical protein